MTLPPQVRTMPATVRIARGEIVRQGDWGRHPAARERVTRDEQGRPLLLRTIEFE